ncbi:hypothetical protein G4G27_23200 [Sphingomonas sp. So64.6b]|uniref:hypothetical protein n=1 Tax=Sphingomonas sp. So64.6b TaxID=2997354 RepID=UPI001601CA72|nr:hypothetical protein [Sphingomonas sp. So64.6b]QNA86562.1 hypothetical protein G4G27_23200 [Sphingomonas sp. So64.6b]
MKALSKGLIGAVALAWSAAALSAPNLPTKPIEQKYYADGSWTVAQTSTAAGCDSKGNPCDIFYPSSLGAGGMKHPIIVWGNGSGTTPIASTTYAYLLRHLASWGFVVIATRDGTTGLGQTMIDSANYMVARNTDAGSIFNGKLDTTKIGAMGHSQGASGAVNAMLKSSGLIRTAVTFHIAQQAYCNPPTLCLLTADLQAATSGSIFYVSGTADWLISPDTQLFGSQLNSNTAYYNATPAPLLKAKAILKGPNHNDVQGTPNCVSGMCANGVHGYLGYPTAWMMWQLQGATDGRDAIKASGGEIFTETTNWQSVLSNVP